MAKNLINNDRYADTLKISPKMAKIIAGVHDKLFTWMEGSVQVGKSVTAALAMSLLIETSSADDNLFIALGYTLTSAKNNIFECGGYGVQYYFGARCTPCKYQGIADALKIQTKTGEKYLVAFGTSTKTANNVWHGWRVSGFIFDEIDRACQESIDEMMQRITAVNDPHIIVTQNPNFPKHPIYKFLDDLMSKDLVNYSHWVIDDNVALTEEKKKRIKNMYDPNTLWYKRFILGERVNPEGLIYNVNDFNYLDPDKEYKYNKYLVVADFGETISATYFGCYGVYYNPYLARNELHLLKEYHHINKNSNMANFKYSENYADDYANFILECREIFKVAPFAVLFDGTTEIYYKMVKAFNTKGIGNLQPKYVLKDDVDERIQVVQNALYTGRFKMNPECVHLKSDLITASYDEKVFEKTGKFERKKDFTAEGHLDAIDSLDYAFSWCKKLLNL